ncbi:MAG: hypothetical protein E6Q89_09940 [Bacteroidia bacterium]|nr:MAG: hypothetical protein E6Q89_09940 [Bacteroidia bacterium]
MENFDARWKELENMLQSRFGKLPDMEGILFLIGMNELGKDPKRKTWSKEQKQDLMHIAVCSLLSIEGYFIMVGKDEEGWPHFENIQAVPASDMASQEQLLKECMLKYFEL